MGEGSLLELQPSPAKSGASSAQPSHLAALNKVQQPLPVGQGQAVSLAQLHLLVPPALAGAGHTQ